jgi:hypothetical protein
MALFSFLIFYTVSRTPWTGDQPLARPLPANRTAQTQNKRTQTSMPRVGFEPATPVFERAKTFHALDRAATVIGEVVSIAERKDYKVYKTIIQCLIHHLASTDRKVNFC